MSARELFEEVRREQESLRQVQHDLNERQRLANSKANEAFVAFMIEEKLLSKHPWVLKIDDVSVNLVASANSSEWTELSDFAETNYHCCFSLQKDDGYIRFDDGEISIHVTDMDQLRSLIDKYGMKVSLSKDTLRNRDQWKEKIAIIDKWEELLKSKS